MKCSMLTLSLVLLLVAVSTARRTRGRGGPGGHGKHHGPEKGDRAACRTALKPSDTEMQAFNNATLVCIGEQDGLNAIVATLGGNCDNNDDDDDDDDDKDDEGRPGKHSRRRGHKHRGRRDVADKLEDAQYTTQATTLRECRARETGRLNEDGSFKDEDLQTEIKAKVAGETIEDNTLKGIQNCTTVIDYNVSEYMKCIGSYCATGSYSPPA